MKTDLNYGVHLKIDRYPNINGFVAGWRVHVNGSELKEVSNLTLELPVDDIPRLKVEQLLGNIDPIEIGKGQVIHSINVLPGFKLVASFDRDTDVRNNLQTAAECEAAANFVSLPPRIAALLATAAVLLRAQVEPRTYTAEGV